MNTCCGCKTYAYNTYYPTTCECIVTKICNMEDRARSAAHFCKLSNAPNKNKLYFVGLCLGCWIKMFEPIYKQVEKPFYLKTSSGKCYRRYRKTVYVKHEARKTRASPKCQWCSIPFEVEKFRDFNLIFEDWNNANFDTFTFF